MRKDQYLQDEFAGTYSVRQQLFLRYLTLVLVDLAVLNLFEEYWDWVTIGSFTISLFAAAVLQLLLALTIKLEHRVAAYFKKKSGAGAKALQFLSAWAILFVSKIVILESLNFFFGERVVFDGPLHGLISFIAVVVVMLITEQGIIRIYKALG